MGYSGWLDVVIRLMSGRGTAGADHGSDSSASFFLFLLLLLLLLVVAGCCCCCAAACANRMK